MNEDKMMKKLLLAVRRNHETGEAVKAINDAKSHADWMAREEQQQYLIWNCNLKGMCAMLDAFLDREDYVSFEIALHDIDMHADLETEIKEKLLNADYQYKGYV